MLNMFVLRRLYFTQSKHAGFSTHRVNFISQISAERLLRI